MNSALKRLLAGAAAAAMLLTGLASAGTALAAGEQNGSGVITDFKTPQTLTVKAPEGMDISGKNLVAVKLASYTSAQYEEKGGTKLVTGYTVSTVTGDNDELKRAIYDALDNSVPKDDANRADLALYKDNPMEWVVRNMSTPSNAYYGSFTDFLNALKRSDALKTAARTSAPLEWNGTDLSATVDPGLYFILEKAGDGFAAINMFTGTKFGADHLDLKNSDGKASGLGVIVYKESEPTPPGPPTPPFDKTVEKGGVVAKDRNGNAIAVGSDIAFKLTATVPDWTAKQYVSYYLAMHDTPSKGLTLKTDSFDANIVKPDGTKVKLTEGADYVVTSAPGDNGSTKVQILFAPTSGSNPTSNLLASDATRALFPVGSTITVTYKCTLNEDAVIDNPDGTTNSAYLEYSNDPGADSHGTTTEKVVKTYTGAFTMHKVDAQGKDLAGAKFRITDAQGRAVKFAKIAADAGVETYRATTDGTGESEITMGLARATFTGLSGTYAVTETYSPLTNRDPGVHFTVTVTMLKDAHGQYTGAYSVAVQGERNNLAVMDATDKDAHTVQVTNVRGIHELSKTGSTWLSIYAATAALLMIGVIALTLSRKRA